MGPVQDASRHNGHGQTERAKLCGSHIVLVTNTAHEKMDFLNLSLLFVSAHMGPHTNVVAGRHDHE